MREDSQDFVFEDSAGLLEWVTADRATVTFQDMADVEAKSVALAELADRWMKATSEPSPQAEDLGLSVTKPLRG